MTDPFAQFTNDAFTETFPEIFGQHRLFLGTGFEGFEVLPRPIIHPAGLGDLGDPSSQTIRQNRFTYKVVIPRASLDDVIARACLTIAVLDKSDDETVTPWVLLDGGENIYRPVRIRERVTYEADNPVLTLHQIWRDKKAAPPWVEIANHG